MRVDVFMKLVFFDIEIDTRDIIDYLKNNNFFLFSHVRRAQINDNFI